MGFDRGHVLIVREHQRQFLLEHQSARRHRGDDIPALVHQSHQPRYIHATVLVHGLQVALFQLWHAAADLFRGQRHRDAVVLENAHQVLGNLRFVDVAITGGKKSHAAPRGPGGPDLGLARRVIFHAPAERLAMEGRQICLGVDIEGFRDQFARRRAAVGRVQGLAYHRDAAQRSGDPCVADQAVAELAFALFELRRLGTQHQVREIDVPLVRRYVRALGLVTEVTEKALVHNLPVIAFLHAVHFQRRRFIHQVEQGRECVAQRDAAAASVAQVENALKFLEKRPFVVKRRVLPVECVPCRRLKAAFSVRIVRRSHTGQDRSGALLRPGESSALGSPGAVSPTRQEPSGSGWRVTALLVPGFRTSRRFRRTPPRGRCWPFPGTCLCTRGFRRRSRP